MKEMDCVEVRVEKEKYAKFGVHKGMQGWICDSRCVDGCWLVNFPRYGEQDDIAEIDVREEDLLVLPQGMDARRNEHILAQHEKNG